MLDAMKGIRFAQRSAAPKCAAASGTTLVDQERAATHLVLLVPGTGPHATDDKPKGTFTKKAERFREMIQDACRRGFADTDAWVELMPIVFHSDLHTLETTKRRMDKVTLPSIPWIRTMDNEVVGDILYYFSTFHGHKILEMIITKLNQAYSEFVERNPRFSGPVSIVAHSLGGLICYEILYLMNVRRQLQQTERAGGDWESARYRGLPDLMFAPSRLFTMGSPHGGTLVFRNLAFSEYHIGSVGFHNIFHPYDPFGYRTEPLVDDDYANIPAVPVTSSSDVPRNLGKRRSLGGSVVDMGKTFVDAISAPVALSTTVLRAAKLSVSGPISASRSFASGQSTKQASTASNGNTDRKGGALSRFLPSFSRPFSFMRRMSHSDASPAMAQPDADPEAPRMPEAYRGHMAATLSVMAVSTQSPPRRQQPSSVRSATCRRSHSSASKMSRRRSRSRGFGASLPAPARRGRTAAGSPEDTSPAKSDEDDGECDMDENEMANQLMHIFSLSRPPSRKRQLAERQGLPLSSRLMQHPRVRVNTAAPEARPPVACQTAPPPRPGVRRARTLPLTVADSRRAVHELVPKTAGDLPPPASRSATASAQQSPERGSPQMPALPYPERMDYIIPFTKRHLQNEYWLGLHAHFSYWTSRETVHHILHNMIRKPVPGDSSVGTSAPESSTFDTGGR
ncbi:hypothetical protein IWQ57_002895 [Coemansia nantahalensis]|uniref:Uncharacterized protein n=1 Tax=Coemansia nantahalensis TaxID=2789366 RepID=A0ACC1JYB8_9FUNG|nr:hypothetical protein IWQ57_002895 [Coemansia nantahalensis]